MVAQLWRAEPARRQLAQKCVKVTDNIMPAPAVLRPEAGELEQEHADMPADGLTGREKRRQPPPFSHLLAAKACVSKPMLSVCNQ